MTATLTITRIYGAIPSRATPKTWIVAYRHGNLPWEDWHPCGDVRGFPSFEQADLCAQRIANGEFSDHWPPGRYVNMR